MNIEKIVGSEWITLREILTKLQLQGKSVSERHLRECIEVFNLAYNEHLTDGICIAHDNRKGRKATKDIAEIEASADDLIKRGIDMLKKGYGTKKAIKENFNLQLLLKEEGII